MRFHVVVSRGLLAGSMLAVWASGTLRAQTLETETVRLLPKNGIKFGTNFEYQVSADGDQCSSWGASVELRSAEFVVKVGRDGNVAACAERSNGRAARSSIRNPELFAVCQAGCNEEETSVDFGKKLWIGADSADNNIFGNHKVGSKELARFKSLETGPAASGRSNASTPRSEDRESLDKDHLNSA